MGMQTTVHDIPQYLITLVEALRAKLRDPDFLARHRVGLKTLPASAN